jgi:hypothetical protein
MYGRNARIDKNEMHVVQVSDYTRDALIRIETWRGASTNLRARLDLFLSVPCKRELNTGIVLVLGNYGNGNRGSLRAASCAQLNDFTSSQARQQLSGNASSASPLSSKHSRPPLSGQPITLPPL